MTPTARFCLLLVAAVLTLVLASPGVSSAQSTTEGAIGGVVTDQTRAVVPGASVTVRNLATNGTGEATTDTTGRFLVGHLQPGVYVVQVALSGFAPYKQDKVVVEVGRVTNLEVALGIAGTAETVNVTEQTPVINTEQPDFSTNIDQTAIATLPTNTRRWSTFALLTPGAAPDGNFGLVSFRGISGLLNNNTVDGGDNTQAFFAEERGRTRIAYSLSADAVREFQVTTSNYSAEYGRAAGGVVNAVTKSGTNEFHGSGFYYIRDNKWGATNPFTTQTVIVNGVNTQEPIKPLDRRQQFGADVGGPIRHDKVFFFASYDEQARNFPGVAAPNNPSAFFAPFSASEQAVFAQRGITPAQQADGLAFLQSLTGVVPRTGDQRLFFPKIDWTINSRNTFSVSYNRLRWNSPAGIQTASVVFRGVESWGNDYVNDDWVNSRLTSIIGSRLTNEARFQWGRDFEFETSQPPIAGEPVSQSGRSPQIVISGAGGLTFGKPNFLERRAYPDERRIQGGDVLSLVLGTHFLKFGGDVNRTNDLQDSLFLEGGEYDYANRVDFISEYENNVKAGNAPLRLYTGFSQGVGPSAFAFSTVDYDAFAQDTWHIDPRLTLDLGLRYEYEHLPGPQIANPLLPASSVFPSDKDNFGPRVGVAWDISGRGDTVLRGGYGIFSGRVINSTIANAITNTGSAAGQLTLNLKNSAPGAPGYPNLLPSASATPVKPDVVVFAPDTQNPMVHEYDAVLEHRVAANTMVSVSYVGSQGRNLPIFIDTNLNPPSGTITYRAIGGPLDGQLLTMPLFTGARPNPNFSRITTIEDVVHSRYNAMVLQVNRRMTRGVQLQASYTYAHATDDGQASQTFTASNSVLNPYDLSLEEGTSSFEIRHRFVASGVWRPADGGGSGTLYEILHGFSIAPIVTVSSGIPYTDTVTGNAPGGTSFGIIGAGGVISGTAAGNRIPSIPRNAFHLPATADVDLHIARAFPFGTGRQIEVLAEFFNLFNRLNYTSVNQQMYTIGGTATAPTLSYNPTFGIPNNANSNYFVFTPRQIQFAARVTF